MTAEMQNEPDDQICCGVAPGHCYLAASGILHWAGTSVYLSRAQANALILRGVLVAPLGYALDARQKRAAAVLAFEQLEEDRCAHGWSEERWLEPRWRRRQYERVHEVLREEQ